MFLLPSIALTITTTYNCIRTLKCLRKLTTSSHRNARAEYLESATSELIYWVTLSTLLVLDSHLSILLRYVPGWNYWKAFTIIVISSPALRISNLIFWDGIVRSVDYLNSTLKSSDFPTLREFLYSLPFLILVIIFPAFTDQGEHGMRDLSEEPQSSQGNNGLSLQAQILSEPTTVTVTGTGARAGAGLSLGTKTPPRFQHFEDCGESVNDSNSKCRKGADILLSHNPCNSPAMSVSASASTSPLRMATRRRLSLLSPILQTVVSEGVALGLSNDEEDICMKGVEVVCAIPESDSDKATTTGKRLQQSSDTCDGDDGIINGGTRLSMSDSSRTESGVGLGLRSMIKAELKSLFDFDLRSAPRNSVERTLRRQTLLAPRDRDRDRDREYHASGSDGSDGSDLVA
jgi:TB2/DP1, HVA22 family